MPENNLQVGVIIGSVRSGRFGPTVAQWFARQAEQFDNLTVDLIDLVDYPLPLVLPGFGAKPDAATQRLYDDLAERLAAADAFVIVTPEYNHSVPASLKNTIDWYLDEWKAKPVGLVSYGGTGGGLRASEHLRQILAEVHAVTIRDTLSFHGVWGQFGEDGELVSPENCEGAAKAQLDQLTWWGNALREARTKVPYRA